MLMADDVFLRAAPECAECHGPMIRLEIHFRPSRDKAYAPGHHAGRWHAVWDLVCDAGHRVQVERLDDAA